MTDPTTAISPDNVVAGGPEPVRAMSYTWRERAFMFLVVGLLAVVGFVACTFETPGEVFFHIFSAVTEPGGGASTTMFDTNTWLSAKWDRSLLDSYRTGKAVVTVDIVSSLPDHALDDANLSARQTYLDLFKAGKLRKVTERATLSFERNGFGWNVIGATPDQFDAKARIAAYLSHATQGPLTFVEDAGVYRDDKPYSAIRLTLNSFIVGAAGTMLSLGSLGVGLAFAIVKGRVSPVLAGVGCAFVITFGPDWLISVLTHSPAPLGGSQPWGLLSWLHPVAGSCLDSSFFLVWCFV
ncbi:hypothetical protein A9R05_42195 (plasmid) [Burkholderia sp. KK1]|uniref:Uncharacterized protein n=1 Tax=Burkholderia sp. M701 TaxID=326454 RepID=V5YNQ4_9BURK|nr:hypothetical protein [Burkholderia sp. M701]AQH05635.1 hypothetical protein A9R05_42195 [Burkholderia sp. KK1]BAO18894.1 hypothetical protein [Burkholderia sp. M701]